MRAAVAEFAAHGFAGARLARIAEAARANKERIYHYFGNKEALFDATLRQTANRIEDAEPFDAEDIASYVTAMLEFHRRNPELIRLLLAEADHRKRRGLPHGKHRAKHYALRVRAIRQAQRDGLIAADVDPRILLYLVLALVATASALPQLTGLIMNSDPDADAPAELPTGLSALLAGALDGAGR